MHFGKGCSLRLHLSIPISGGHRGRSEQNTHFEELAQSSADAFFHSVAVTSDPMRRRLFSEPFLRELKATSRTLSFNATWQRRTPTTLSPRPFTPISKLGCLAISLPRSIAQAWQIHSRFALPSWTTSSWSGRLRCRLSSNSIEGPGKYILKRALEPLLPRKILYRPKQGFSMPISQWFRGPLRARLRRAIGSPLLGTRGTSMGVNWSGWSPIMSKAGMITRPCFG